MTSSSRPASANWAARSPPPTTQTPLPPAASTIAAWCSDTSPLTKRMSPSTVGSSWLREHPGRHARTARSVRLLVVEDPLVRGAAHRDGADVGDEGVVVERAVVILLAGEEPVERVVGVGDEAVEAGGGVEDGAESCGPVSPRPVTLRVFARGAQDGHTLVSWIGATTTRPCSTSTASSRRRPRCTCTPGRRCSAPSSPSRASTSRTPTPTTSRTSTASRATTGSARSWQSRGIELPEGDPDGRPDREDRLRARQPQERRVRGGARDATASRPTRARGALVEALAERGIALAVVSSSRNAPDVLRAADMIDFFPTIVDGRVATERHLAGKPAPDTFLYAAEQLGAEPRARSCSRTRSAASPPGKAGHFGLVDRRRPRRRRRGAHRERRRPWSSPTSRSCCERRDAPLMPDVERRPRQARAGPSHEAPPVTDFLDRTRFPVDPWRLVEPRFSDADLGTTETLFARRQRLPRHARQRRGGPRLPRARHVHQRLPRDLADPARRGGVRLRPVGQTIVNAPDAKIIRLYVDDEPLLLPVADLLEYERVARLPHRRAHPRRPVAHARPASGCTCAPPAWSRSPSATSR